MAYQSIWYFTDIPENIVDTIEQDLEVNFDANMSESRIEGDVVDKTRRNSRNTWVPTSHWLGGFMWHYIERANRENFMYDLKCIDNESMQYTQYHEGEFYGWHCDAGLGKLTGEGGSAEEIRKLSFVLQLSNPSDYEGGNLQLLNDSRECYFAPRKRGTIILFDSRTQHRVLKVTKGLRKSIVGWTVGPRWK